LAARVLSHFKQKIQGLNLVPGSGGCFELTVDNELIYSKLKTGTFPDESAIVELLESRKAK
jgi:selenoprotein W-related protein